MVYVCAKVGLNSAGEFVDYFCQFEWQWRGNFYSSLDVYYRRKLFGKPATTDDNDTIPL